ncbi:alpha-2,8-sialyltransferase 8F-like [Pseudophryne corroboree]|uniref:alpha-2,8-sialyltransferase 8F-like n=1 Tax=Pseudophryne corroboree TaxID=495146 RepID=UPI0030821C8F
MTVCRMQRGRWILLLSVVALHGFYSNLQFRARGNIPWSQTGSVNLLLTECAILRSNMLQRSLRSINTSDFLSYINDLQRCPWEYNVSEHIQIKSELAACCNTSHTLLVTQQNAPLGHKLTYETSPKRHIVVNENIYQMLPKLIVEASQKQQQDEVNDCRRNSQLIESEKKNVQKQILCTIITPHANFNKDPTSLELFSDCVRVPPQISPFIGKQFETCAVVGNGGILLNSSCGDEIDKMDYVFRFNLPPLLFRDTGEKSDLVSANPSILVKKFAKLSERRKPFIDLVKSYGSAMIILPAFSYVHNTELSLRVQHSLQDFDLQNSVVFFHPDYLTKLSTYWETMGLSAKRMSSGLMLVSVAMEVCKKVTLYGFWPFAQDPEGNLIPHHYYDDICPKPGFHSMPEEFYFYTKMHLKGALHLKVGKC